ncbi:unnamed protein product [Dicrocoelium dendriticum]|nr:unnamed protein product [Dicrocoelium dendriticum]
MTFTYFDVALNTETSLHLSCDFAMKHLSPMRIRKFRDAGCLHRYTRYFKIPTTGQCLSVDFSSLTSETALALLCIRSVCLTASLNRHLPTTSDTQTYKTSNSLLPYFFILLRATP